MMRAALGATPIATALILLGGAAMARRIGFGADREIAE